jgi:CBS domain-containing protein
MHVRELINRPAVTIDAAATIMEAAERMEQAGVGCLAVTDSGVPVGLVTDRDLVRRVLARRLPTDGRVDSVMSAPLVSVGADDDLRVVFDTFRQRAVRRLGILEGGKLVGVASIDDLFVVLVGELADLARPVTAEVLFAHHDTAVPAVGS